MDKPIALHKIAPIKAASEVYVIRDGQVLMFKRGKDAPHFPGFWVGPGGHVDEHENFLSAAIREVFEETGITISLNEIKLKAIAIHQRPDKNATWILPVFLAKLELHQEIISSSEGEAQWIKIEELAKMDKVLPHAKYYFDPEF